MAVFDKVTLEISSKKVRYHEFINACWLNIWFVLPESAVDTRSPRPVATARPFLRSLKTTIARPTWRVQATQLPKPRIDEDPSLWVQHAKKTRAAGEPTLRPHAI